jgi:hypothetical protein
MGLTRLPPPPPSRLSGIRKLLPPPALSAHAPERAHFPGRRDQTFNENDLRRELGSKQRVYDINGSLPPLALLW